MALNTENQNVLKSFMSVYLHHRDAFWEYGSLLREYLEGQILLGG